MPKEDPTHTLPYREAKAFLKENGIPFNESSIEIANELVHYNRLRVKKNYFVKLMRENAVLDKFFKKHWRRGLTADGMRILALYETWSSRNDDFLALKNAYDNFGMPARLPKLPAGEPDDLDMQSYIGVEGKPTYRLHLIRERDRKLITAKRKLAMSDEGSIKCEACGFDFEKKYGVIGKGFCEVHHDVPLSERRHASKTELSDLVILCSNCHRMIHRTSPLMRLKDFKESFFES